MALAPNTPVDEERQRFESELVSLDPATQRVQPLVKLSPGTQVGPHAVSGDSIAWVEVDNVDLRAYGWKLHLTDAKRASDTILMTDPGVHPEGMSVMPRIAYDGGTLVVSLLAGDGGNIRREIHLLGAGRDDVIATMPRDHFVISISIDAGAVIWIEDIGALDPDKTPTLGLYDRQTRRTSSVRTAVKTAFYQAALTPDALFLATGLGIMHTDRAVTEPIVRSPLEGFTVDQLAVLGDYLIYRNFDPSESVAAIDLRTMERALLGVGATTGPIFANGRALWYERSGGEARIAIVHL